MSEDGRRFSGSLNDDDGSTREWSGVRQGGSRAEPPPLRVAWLHEALVGRGQARLEARDRQGALDDARRATALCCRVPSGWSLVAEAGEGDEAEAARAEAEWLEG